MSENIIKEEKVSFVQGALSIKTGNLSLTNDKLFMIKATINYFPIAFIGLIMGLITVFYAENTSFQDLTMTNIIEFLIIVVLGTIVIGGILTFISSRSKGKEYFSLDLKDIVDVQPARQGARKGFMITDSSQSTYKILASNNDDWMQILQNK